ncbi:MAG: hypothetical protein ACW98K_06250 [Candidatus Kariarchaeaceae archaeon]|jgi:hypothetical protein
MSTREKPEKEKKKREDALTGFADSLLKVEEEDREAKQEILKEGIEEREKSSKSAMTSSRMVSGTLSTIRDEAGLSAFIGTSGKIKSPKFRRGKFIQLLAREVLLIGRDEMKPSGGVVSMEKLEEYFKESRENWILRENDLEDAVLLLDKQDMIPDLQKVDKEIKVIHFRPTELSRDTRQLLVAAMGIDVDREKLTTILGWDIERVGAAMKQLVQEGIAIEDGDTVYFPGL